MLITDLTQNLNTNQTQTLSLKQVRAEAKNWQVGSLLKAFVVSNSPKEGMTLNIQGQQYKVASQDNLSNLQVGQRLDLEVMKQGEQPQLKVVQPQVQSRETIQNEGLKRNLPLQKPLGQLLNALENLGQQSGKQEVNQQIRALSQQILNMLPDNEKVSTADGLKQAIRDSGHFLENKLMQLATNSQAADRQSLQQDIKTGLLRLLQSIKANSPPPQRPGTEQPAAEQPPAKTAPMVYDKAGLQATARQNALQAATRPLTSPTAGQTPAAGQNATSGPTPAAQATAQGQAQTQTATARPQIASTPAGQESVARPVVQQAPPTSQLQGHEGRHTVTPVSQEQHTINSVGEARKDIEAGIARIQTNQINSVRTEAGHDKPALFVEIPIRNQNNQVNVMQLNIQRDREAGGPSRPAVWSISLGFELVELGPIRAGMTLVGDKQISVNLWAENQDTVELFDEQMAQLRSGLQNAGLVAGHIGIQQGAPSTQEVLGNNAQASGLLDIEV